MIIQGVSYLSDFEAKKAITAEAARLCLRGWMLAGDGSLSVRVGPNAIWVTVQGADKANLTQDKLVRIDLNGKQMATNKPKPLGEDIEAQLKIYKENDRVRSIIHAYPISAIEFSAKDLSAEAADFTPAVRRLGRIRLIEPLGSSRAAGDASLLAKNDNGVIIRGDGCMMWGETPHEAADYVELLDYYCKAAKALGVAGALGPGQAPALSLTGSSAARYGVGVYNVPAYGSAGYQAVNSEGYQAYRGTGFIPRCTAECSACGNTSCTERRNGYAGHSVSAAGSFIAAASSAGNNDDESHGSCTGECSSCLDAGCTDRHESTCSGSCEHCTEGACSHRSVPGEGGSSTLPKGMTGLIRPGEPLPPISDERTDSAAADKTASVGDLGEAGSPAQVSLGYTAGEARTAAVDKQQMITKLAQHYLGN